MVLVFGERSLQSQDGNIHVHARSESELRQGTDRLVGKAPGYLPVEIHFLFICVSVVSVE